MAQRSYLEISSLTILLKVGVQVIMAFISVLPHGLRGASQAGNSSDVVAHLVDLRRKKEELEQQERELDEQYQRMQQCLRNISEDTTNDQYPLTQPVLTLACGQHIE